MIKCCFGFFACLGVLLAGSDALAWGPGVHLVTGNFILDNLSLLTPFLSQLLSANRMSFLYGCLSADIFLGKGFKITPDHCHNWDNGVKLLHNAGGDPHLAAYAYGYLCHLAADTVAHNYYVPTLLQKTPGSGKLSHVYIEMQADRLAGCCFREAEVIVQLSDRCQDASLCSVLRKPRLEFSVKKKLFQGSLAMYRFKHWKSSLSFIDRALPLASGNGYLLDMLDLSSSVMVDVLNNPERAVSLDYDPMGFKNLARVRRQRRSNRFLRHSRRVENLDFQPDRQLLRLKARLN
ncbi:MAG: zinc dependent phospholipase C family protein [Desulfohalobiaceae bacterium]